MLQVYRYCQRVNSLLADGRGRPVVHVCGLSPHKRANAALLACCYGVICRGMTAEEVFAPFLGASPVAQRCRIPCCRGVSRCVHFAAAMATPGLASLLGVCLRRAPTRPRQVAPVG